MSDFLTTQEEAAAKAIKEQEIAADKAKQEKKEKDRAARVEEKKHTCMASPTVWIASVVKENGFRLYKGGSWYPESVNREMAFEYSDTKHAYSKSEQYCIRHCMNYVHAFYTDIVPNGDRILTDEDGEKGLNTYCPPTLELRATGSHDSIDRIIHTITGGVAGGAEYFTDWCAAKIQNPGVRSNTAILFEGKSSTGKGSIVRALFEILGESNCSLIDSKDLENQAGNNGSFIGQLFTNINEVNLRDDRMSDIIKNMIDGPTVKLRDKYIRTSKNGVTNRNSFIFTTNILQSIKLDSFDRRFTVFNDGIQTDISDEYRKFIINLWDPITHGPTTSFMNEIAHWGYFLKNKQLSYERLQQLQVPFETEARKRLIQRTQSTSKDFFDEEISRGIDSIIDEYFDFKKLHTFAWIRPEMEKYIFPEGKHHNLAESTTFSDSLLYDVYKYYTNRYSPSKHPANKGMFLEAAKEHGWEVHKKAVNGTVTVVRGVKRSATVIKDAAGENKEADVISIDAQLDQKGIGK